MEMHMILARVEKRVSAIGHAVVWDVHGEHLAHGHCHECQATFRVTIGHDGGYAVAGECASVECMQVLSLSSVLP